MTDTAPAFSDTPPGTITAADIPPIKSMEELVFEIWHKVHAIEQRLIDRAPVEQTPAGTVTVIHQ